MKLKVQRIKGDITIGGSMESLEEVKQGKAEVLKEEGPLVYKMAIAILEQNPQFNEVIVNTELTEDDQ